MMVRKGNCQAEPVKPKVRIRVQLERTADQSD